MKTMLDDRHLNPLRLALLAIIAGYFAWLWFHPPATPASPAPVLQKPTQTTSRPSQPATLASCPAHILEVGASTHEVRLKIDGAADRILVYTAAGPVTASTETAGSAGEYRVLLPAPPQAVQLDDCPPLNLP